MRGMGDGGSRNCADVSTTPMGASPHFCSARAKMAPLSGAAGSVAASTPFRAFRVLMTGKNSSGSDHLMCAGFEIYGTLRLAPQDD